MLPETQCKQNMSTKRLVYAKIGKRNKRIQQLLTAVPHHGSFGLVWNDNWPGKAERPAFQAYGRSFFLTLEKREWIKSASERGSDVVFTPRERMRDPDKP